MTDTPRDRPIIFSGASVRAILDGSKTQTRRVVRNQPGSDVTDVIRLCGDFVAAYPNRAAIRPFVWAAPSFYGLPGDRLWVRETWISWRWNDRVTPRDFVRRWGDDDPREYVGYVADNDIRRRGCDMDGKLRPSIFMPRWASRLVLPLTDVRVERLQSITRDDAMAEGIPQTASEAMQFGLLDCAPHEWDNRTSVENYAHLWDSLNARRGVGWDVNPWVWVLTFANGASA